MSIPVSIHLKDHQKVYVQPIIGPRGRVELSATVECPKGKHKVHGE